MSFWQFQAAVIGVHKANTPAEGAVAAPSADEFEAALERSLVH